jgi:oxygen-independent coproporphyrinogen-3 oxidase
LVFLPRFLAARGLAVEAMQFIPPRAAYIHIPFCVHRCGYCNFTVVAGRDDLIEPLLAALATELSWLNAPREVDTLYFGGGTPTYLAPEPLRRLCDLVLKWHPLAAGYEWTVEANPGDLDAQRLAVLADCGVNRLSLGSQSFHARKLNLLERDHTATDIERAVALSRQAGMAVSLDLIFGVPGETLEDWQADLQQALALAPEHVSTYGLTFEQGTQFWNRRQHGELASIDEELERDMYLAAIDTLNAAGFEHYEVSNFARPGKRSRHNETYWSGRGYFAAGPGASRYVDGRRQTNHRSTTAYLDRVLKNESPVAEEETLDAEERAREFLVFGLRRLEGVEREEFQSRTGYALDELAGATIERFVRLGMLSDDGQRVRLTREGLLVSDSLWPELL